MSEKKYYLSKKGLENFKKEYENLKKYKLDKTQLGSPRMLESEDLSSEFLSYQEDLELMENRLSELENILRNTVLIKAPLDNIDLISLGAKVKIKSEKEIDEYKIVGTLEANPMEGKISDESPVGKILIGKKKGEEIIINQNSKVSYKIIDVQYEEN